MAVSCIVLGSRPAEEGEPLPGRDEIESCRRFRHLIAEQVGEPPKGAVFTIRAEGGRHNLAVVVDSREEEAREWAESVLWFVPVEWTPRTFTFLGSLS